MNKSIKVMLGLIVVLLLGVFAAILIQNKPSGAISSPFLSESPCLNIGGVMHCAAKVGLKTATTTVCAIQSPAATSTLEFGSIRFSTSTTTASVVYLAKASTAFATTTNLATVNLSANAQATIVASTTPTTGDTVDAVNVFAPSQWFVVSMTGGTGTYSPVGVCQAGWRQI